MITDEYADKLYAEIYQKSLEITRLRAENERLREALKPFELVIPYDFAADDETVQLPIKASAFRCARAAFKGDSE